MANKLYEEYDVERIAISIRNNAPRKVGQREFLLTEMPSGIDDVYIEGYENGGEQGYKSGLIDGEEKVKTEEARTADNVNLTNQGVPEGAYSAYITVNVDAGYYAEDTPKTFRASDGDLDSIVDGVYENGHSNGYDEGWQEGHDEGYSDGASDGYLDGYDDGYSVGFEAGIAGGVADPTTVWEIVTKPILTNLPTNVTISFNSAGIEFAGITKTGAQGLNYVKPDGSSTAVYTSRMGWVNNAYSQITILEKITDESFLAWLNENATLISGSIDGDDEGESDLEEMLLNGDENYDDEGKEFYNVYKWIDIWNSSLSSAPVVISAMNNHPSLWLHAYIRITDAYGYDYYRSIAIEPDQGENSIEIDLPLERYVLEGVRWSRRGI